MLLLSPSFFFLLPLLSLLLHPFTHSLALPPISPLSLPPHTIAAPPSRPPLHIDIPIPASQPPRHITLVLRLIPQYHLPQPTIENCLAQLDVFVGRLARDPRVGEQGEIPGGAFPLRFFSNERAQGRVVLEVEEGDEHDERGLRVQTLGLSVRGLWDAMVRQGRLVEGTWEIW